MFRVCLGECNDKTYRDDSLDVDLKNKSNLLVSFSDPGTHTYVTVHRTESLGMRLVTYQTRDLVVHNY